MEKEGLGREDGTNLVSWLDKTGSSTDEAMLEIVIVRGGHGG
jgi:hypothetical protein